MTTILKLKWMVEALDKNLDKYMYILGYIYVQTKTKSIVRTY
jgi:hypothetical protein